MRVILRRVLPVVLAYAGFVAVYFPYGTDPLDAPPPKLEQEFYDTAFQATKQGESDYERIARQTAEQYQVKQKVKDFVATYGLASKRVLEVGAGSGSLQDIVDDYTGLDLSATARRHFHKPFVQASATAMPFRHSEFDGLWTVWVVEHIPNPEMAMMEMRRVVKDGGFIFFMPAWECTWWAPQGYEVRPYSDLSLSGKMAKASIPLWRSNLYRATHKLPVNYLRTMAARTGPTRLRFHRIAPNFEKYWQADSDAVVSLDPYEASLWFTSRGDKCLNCGDYPVPLLPQQPLIIQVFKKPERRSLAAVDLH
jgi:SAM-dependent methyltransferase